MAQALSDEAAFESRLTDGTDRFLAHAIEHAFTIGRRNSRDFLRHFPPSLMMEALKDSPSLRADILESATGVRRKVALKKGSLSSGEDLQIALEEGEAAADDVVRLFRPDDRVRYLSRGKLWSFLVEGEFWKANKSDKAGYERAQAHLAFLLDRALRDHVINHQDIIEGITITKLCQLMPRGELETAMNSALALGRRGQPFSDRDLYEKLSSATIVTYIPLAQLWEEVVQPFIAVEHGLSESLNAQRAEKPAAAAAQVVEKTAVVQEEGPRPANTNDQPVPAVQAQPRPVANKPAVGPAAAPQIQRPRVAQPMPVAATKAAAPAARVPVPFEAPPEDEDGAFDVHFENLTASKG
jgi:hypothetical protein